jgi:uncharacterized protein (TIGR02217 family)
MSTFIESPRFPDEMAYWASGGADYNTTVIQLNSGFEQRNQNWNQSRATYDITSGLQTQTSQYAISDTIAFFRSMKGRAFGFRFKDFQDYKITVLNGTLDSGIGTGFPTYQLYKTYTTGTMYDKKSIKKPVVGTIKVYRNATLIPIGILPSNISIDYTNGIVTFVPDLLYNIASITIGINPEVTTTLPHSFIGGEIIYLSSLNTGNTLEKTVCVVNSILSTTTFSILATNLASITTGQVAKYPQLTDTLTCEGEFDIAARFDMDNLKYEVTTGGLIQLSNIKIVEIRT